MNRYLAISMKKHSTWLVFSFDLRMSRYPYGTMMGGLLLREGERESGAS
jgi:hypothetical protein